MWYMHDVGWAWWLVMSIGMVAFWGLVVYGVVWLARGASSSVTLSGPAESPRKVLKRRLAAGEIGFDEYEALRAVVDDQAPAAASRTTPG